LKQFTESFSFFFFLKTASQSITLIKTAVPNQVNPLIIEL